MSKKTYHPDRGDLVMLNFFPAAGREIDKRRLGVVISPIEYNRASGLCVVVPATTDLRAGPLYVPAPAGTFDQPSQFLCDLFRSVDYRERSIVTLGKRLDPATLDEITACLLELIDPVYRG